MFNDPEIVDDPIILSDPLINKDPEIIADPDKVNVCLIKKLSAEDAVAA